MSKMRSTLMLLMLGATLAACGSDPIDPPKTTPPGDRLSAILSAPGPAKECLDILPSPAIDQQTTADNPCPDAGLACANVFPVRWCKVDGTPAIAMCEKGAWVIKAKKCP